MPLFIKDRDYEFFKNINKELVNEIIDTDVIIYKFDSEYSEKNMYGESPTKIYMPGLKIDALIDNQDEETEDDEMGANVFQTITFAFRRNVLKEKDFYPERGDMIKWNNAYFEIGSVVDNQMIAGRAHGSDDYEGLPHSVVCTSHMVNLDSINVREEGE